MRKMRIQIIVMMLLLCGAGMMAGFAGTADSNRNESAPHAGKRQLQLRAEREKQVSMEQLEPGDCRKRSNASGALGKSIWSLRQSSR